MKRSISALLLLTTACSHVDTGQVDYRTVSPGMVAISTGSDTPDCSDRGVSCGKLQYRFLQPTVADSFKPDELYAINLDQGAIGEQIMEGKVFGHEFGKTAEIAILANVFEFAGTDEDAKVRAFVDYAVTPQFIQGNEKSQFKLVYFSNDVRRGQAFNFSNLPIVPATAYQGRSIGIQLVVMEIDGKSGPVSALLNKLADFGLGSLGLPAGAKQIVSSLGQSIFDGGSKDDLLLDYRFVLSPGGRTGVSGYPVFRPGRYAVIRKRDRTTPIAWNVLRVDENTGRLFEGNLPVKKDLYLTMSVVRPSAREKAEFYRHSDFSTFRAAVDAELAARDKPLEQVTTAVSKAVAAQSSQGKRTMLSSLWSSAESALDRYRALVALAAAPKGCNALVSAQPRERDLARRDAQSQVRSFILAAAKVSTEPDITISTATEPAFAPNDQAALIDQVASFFVPWEDDKEFKEADFKTFDAFKSTFLETGKSEALVDLAIKRAETFSPTSDQCELLRKAALAS